VEGGRGVTWRRNEESEEDGRGVREDLRGTKRRKGKEAMGEAEGDVEDGTGCTPTVPTNQQR